MQPRRPPPVTSSPSAIVAGLLTATGVTVAATYPAATVARSSRDEGRHRGNDKTQWIKGPRCSANNAIGPSTSPVEVAKEPGVTSGRQQRPGPAPRPAPPASQPAGNESPSHEQIGNPLPRVSQPVRGGLGDQPERPAKDAEESGHASA